MALAMTLALTANAAVKLLLGWRWRWRLRWRWRWRKIFILDINNKILCHQLAYCQVCGFFYSREISYKVQLEKTLISDKIFLVYRLFIIAVMWPNIVQPFIHRWILRYLSMTAILKGWAPVSTFLDNDCHVTNPAWLSPHFFIIIRVTS